MIETLYRVSVVLHEDNVNYFSRQYGDDIVNAKKGCVDSSNHLAEDGRIEEVAIFSCELAAKLCERLLLRAGGETMLDFSDEEIEDIKLNMAFIAGYQNMMDAIEEEKLIEMIKELVSMSRQTQYDEEYLKGVEEALCQSLENVRCGLG